MWAEYIRADFNGGNFAQLPSHPCKSKDTIAFFFYHAGFFCRLLNKSRKSQD